GQGMLSATKFRTNGAGSFTVILAILIHEFDSTMAKVCVPADTLNIPSPVYGELPPLADTLTVVVPPEQAIVPAEMLVFNAGGCERLPETAVAQPLKSVTA